ncbi:multicopper oxidase family protein [Azospirillum sp. SYSU D00513]|uniref:multicopper oxidase family protein n=1 Tax=Azospirillum sp. SYSU D00513 TaxID=2812561 RepID=UPI001FFF68AA|nr:multicopper oxidase family protein [Azospirillum sp. SYSU D00513]
MASTLSRPPGRSAAKRMARTVLPVLALSAALSPLASPASAWERGVFSNPPVLPLQKGVVERPNLLAVPQDGSGKDSKDVLDLRIDYTDSEIYNPATGRYDKVRLRSYVGTGVDPDRPFIAPTIEVAPGQTVSVKLKNDLPKDPTCADEHSSHMNTPHCFNGTNLHSHGLWVSPSGNSDNVLLSIYPGVAFEYRYDVPPEHPAGTFWYHPHRHGSTALQVASGMAGALIVRGNRLPGANNNGDIDTLLKGKNLEPFTERTLVLQQIQYYCLNDVKDSTGAVKKTLDWNCKEGQTGVIDGYTDEAGNSVFGPNSWKASGRFTSINGQVLPTFRHIKTGDVERWRLVHAGVRDTINLEIRRMKLDALKGNPDLGPSKQEDFVKTACSGDRVEYQVIAADGLTMAKAQARTQVTLQPGYRNDFLIAFPEPGAYCAVDVPLPGPGSVNQGDNGNRVLAFVEVEGTATLPTVNGKPDLRRHITEQLVASAERTMPAAVRNTVVNDLKNGLTLSKFVPHGDLTGIPDHEVGKQFLSFYIDGSESENGQQVFKFEVNNNDGSPGRPYDSKPYDPSRIDRELTLGTVDEWTLESHAVSHPFHIHVNPFQVVAILKQEGDKVIDVSAEDAPRLSDDDEQYRGMKGVWKDTLWIKSLNGLAAPGQSEAEFVRDNEQNIYKIIVRTKYQRYVGDFVLHCHILDHEDQGMMQNVRISLPKGPAPMAMGQTPATPAQTQPIHPASHIVK